MAAKGGLSLSPNWNQAGSEERVIGRLCRREAVPLTRSGSERLQGLTEWARSALVKMAVRLSLFGVWGAVAPHDVFQDSGEARHLLLSALVRVLLKKSRHRRPYAFSTVSTTSGL